MNLSIPSDRLSQLANEFGTPLYVYDARTIRSQIKKLSKAFSMFPVKFHYAAKALTNIHILQLIKSEGLGLDAVSIQEVQLALMAGFLPEDILFTPNCVAFAELEDAIALGVKVNIDSLPLLEHFGHKYGQAFPVTLRINPHIMAGGNYQISTGHIDSKFGISIHQVRHIERLVQLFGIRVEGLHMHTGSDILDVDVFLRGADLLFEQALNFPDLQFVDFGSGFKVAYKPEDHTTDIAELGQKMSKRYEAFCAEYGRAIAIHFEPGKFLVSESGYFLARVNQVKQTTASVFAGLDTGFNHLIRPTLYNAYHHISNISNPGGHPKVYSVVGSLCETDTFAWDRQLPEVREGDILCFHNAGAYGFMMSSNYNSRYRPAEVLADGKNYRLIRRRETLEDLLGTQLPLETVVPAG
ncbi:MAG TPA: diaminopimelate decarboxylase [Edaphocola sp.]|nr:diaminopimelate decarboxylase [Edaphocola sp.]